MAVARKGRRRSRLFVWGLNQIERSVNAEATPTVARPFVFATAVRIVRKTFLV